MFPSRTMVRPLVVHLDHGRPSSRDVWATSRSGSIPQCFTSNSEALPLVRSSETSSSSVINFKTSMTRATLEDSTAGLGQTLCTGRPLVGGLFFCNVSELCTSSLAHRLPQGLQAQSMRHAADAGLGLLLVEVGQLHVIRAPWVVSSAGPTLSKAQQHHNKLPATAVAEAPDFCRSRCRWSRSPARVAKEAR